MKLRDIDPRYIYEDEDSRRCIKLSDSMVSAHDGYGRCEVFFYWRVWPLCWLWSRERAIDRAWDWLRALKPREPENLTECLAQIAILEETQAMP